MNILKAIIVAFAIILVSTSTMAINEPIIDGVPDQRVNRNFDALDKIIDLRDYASDERNSPGELFYTIDSQTNIHLIDCFIEDDYFVSCNAPHEDALGMSTIKVKAINSNGLGDVDEFNINVNETFTAETIEFESDRDQVIIEPGDSINLQLTVENTFDETVCFNLDASLDNEERDEIRTSLGNDEFCLNSGEQTSITLTITSLDDARICFYDIEVVLDYPQGERTRTIDVEIVDQEDPIDISRTTDYFVCKEPYTQEIGIRLENNSGRTQTINLNASHELLLPTFEFATTTLSGGEEDEMILRIHTNETTALEEYTIQVFARSENYFVERDIVIRLIECQTDEFDLEITPITQNIERNTKEFYIVKLIGKSDKDLDIRLSSDGTLPNTLDKYNVFLPKHGEKTVQLEVSARESDDDGAHKIKVTAWSANETEEETVKAIVESEHKIELLVANNDFEARICSATNGQVYEITIKNTGDFEEDVELTLRNVPETIQAVLSEDEIEIRKGEEKTIFVFVNPGFNTDIGNYSITLEADWGEDFARETLKFRVVEADETAQQNVIEFVSYPRDITIAPGEERQLEFTIRNPLAVPMHNIQLRVFGLLNNEITIFPISVSELEGGETITLKRTIKANANAQTKVYNATIEVRADGYVTAKPMKVSVTTQAQNSENDQNNGFLTGFLTLLGGDFIIGGVIILILLIAIIIVLSLLHSNKSEELVYYNRDDRSV